MLNIIIVRFKLIIYNYKNRKYYNYNSIINIIDKFKNI